MINIDTAYLLDRIGFVVPTLLLAAFFSGYSIFMGSNPGLYLSLPLFHQIMYALIFGGGFVLIILAVSLISFKVTEIVSGDIRPSDVGKLLSFYIMALTILISYFAITGDIKVPIVEELPIQDSK